MSKIISIEEATFSEGRWSGYDGYQILCGVGKNDASYVTQNRQEGWYCPHYRAWGGLIFRSNSPEFKERRVSYKDCSVVEEWKLFSNFLDWSVKNYVGGWHLDKDIRVKENKIYSPETCAYVPPYINALLKQKLNKGSMGVSFSPKRKNTHFIAYCGESIKLGWYATAQEAHREWQWEKARQIEASIAKYMSEPSGAIYEVAEALTQRVWQLRLDYSSGIETKTI